MPLSPSAKQTQLATSIPFFAMIVAPLGVAGQNIGLGLALLMFIILMVTSGASSLIATLQSSIARGYLVLWALIILPIACATAARGGLTDLANLKEASRFFWGYLLSCSMVIVALSLRSFAMNRRFLIDTAQVLITILGLVSLSQLFLGWKFEHGAILPQIKRAQGFYSHPLTLAYAALPMVSWVTGRFMAKMSDWKNTVTWLALMSVVVCSQSVTVIVLTGIAVLFLAIKVMSRRAVVGFSVAVCLVSVVAVSVPNPIHAKFHAVLSGQRGDHETNYPDDRLAFWHANWEMFRDAPMTGHGTGLEQDDRRPFYERIGLGHIKRMYEAHNMFLQYAVEGGLIPPLALIGFFCWWTIILLRGLNTERWYRLALLITPGLFALGGLTQNAVQDSEVRYLLLLVCGASLLVK
jgi:O-antigen ligase